MIIADMAAPRTHHNVGRQRGVHGLKAGAGARLFPKQRPDQPAGIKADCGGNIQELQ
jgi:hypothetical protein